MGKRLIHAKPRGNRRKQATKSRVAKPRLAPIDERDDHEQLLGSEVKSGEDARLIYRALQQGWHIPDGTLEMAAGAARHWLAIAIKNNDRTRMRQLTQLLDSMDKQELKRVELQLRRQELEARAGSASDIDQVTAMAEAIARVAREMDTPPLPSSASAS